MCNTRRSAATLPRMLLVTQGTSSTQARTWGLCLVINSWQLSTTGSHLAALVTRTWGSGAHTSIKTNATHRRHISPCQPQGGPARSGLYPKRGMFNPLIVKGIGQLNTLPVSAIPFQQFFSIGNLTHPHRQAFRYFRQTTWTCVPLGGPVCPHAGRKSLHPRQPTLQSR